MKIKNVFNRILDGGIMRLLLPVNGNWHAVILYRLAHALFKMKVPIVPHFIYWLNYVFFGVELHYKAELGKNFFLGHTNGVIIGSGVVIGDYCVVYSGVVVGARGKEANMPHIGNHVLLGAGAKVLGDVLVGDNVKIGANTLILKNVKDNAVVFAAEGVEVDTKAQG